MNNWLILVLFLLIAPMARAGVAGALDGFYFTDTFTMATTTSNSRTYYSFDLMADLGSKEYFFAGFHVSQVNVQDSNGSTTTQLSSMDMGPMFKWVFGKSRLFSISGAYSILAKGKYSSGSTNSELTGTSLLGALEYANPIAEEWYLGFKLNYYSISYSKNTTTSSASDVSYSRNLIFPSISLSWRK